MMQRRSQVSTNSESGLNNNKGFSLVEMIIVMAIIAILTGISFISLGLLQSAKAKEAAVTFEAEISDIVTKSKGQVIEELGVRHPEYYYALRIYKSTDDRYYIQRGVYDSETDSLSFGGVLSNPNSGKGREISSRVTVKYLDPITGMEYAINSSTNGVVLVFDRNGRCLQGYGTFRFYKKNGNNIANVTVNKNGSHQSN